MRYVKVLIISIILEIGFNMIKRTPLQVPHSPINTERNYIQNLNDAYSEHAGHIINVIDDDNAVVSKYRKHLDRNLEYRFMNRKK